MVVGGQLVHQPSHTMILARQWLDLRAAPSAAAGAVCFAAGAVDFGGDFWPKVKWKSRKS